MRRRGLSAFAAALGAALLTAATARAQDVADLPVAAGNPPEAPSGLGLFQKSSYWRSSARPRPFFSALMELGALYFKPNVAFGYGRPHAKWFGAEGYASITPSGGAQYAGLRVVLPQLELRGGARYSFSLDRYFLDPRGTFTREDTERVEGPKSRYVAAEAELSGSLPLLGGSLFGVFTGYAVVGAPQGYYVFEEALHTVMKPPFVYRARLGFLGDLDGLSEFRLGVAAELIGNPGRDSTIVRVGPVINVMLTHHLDATGSVMVVAATPDTLGLLGADLGQIGLRYRWATGDRWPEFP